VVGLPSPPQVTKKLVTNLKTPIANTSYKEDRKKANESKRFEQKRVYTSRRAKNYDDNDSNGEEDACQDNAQITYKDTNGNSTTMKPNPKFMPFKSLFKRLIKPNGVYTPHIVISMIINYSSEFACAVLKKNDH
jgi:hypothetical protein